MPSFSALYTAAYCQAAAVSFESRQDTPARIPADRHDGGSPPSPVPYRTRAPSPHFHEPEKPDVRTAVRAMP